MKKDAPRRILAGMTRAEILEFVRASHLQSFRANQLADWIYRHRTVDPAAMSNLPAAFRDTLAAGLLAPSSHISAADRTADGTEKLLLTLHDGEAVEMVIIPSEERVTFCLSTQVGCPVRCRFCASGADGLTRNLEAGEIVEQMLWGAQRIGKLPDNIVFMGIGEGLLNFRELAKAIEILTSPDGFGMAPRRLTVSTSGIVPGIDELAKLDKELTLAISLHAVSDEVRARLIPNHVRYPIAEILAAADRYREKAGRMVTLEYTLLAGVNDSREDALALARIAREHHAKINLIPYNATGGDFKRPSEKVLGAFLETIERTGAHVTLRRERGSGENAACGQLRQAKK